MLVYEYKLDGAQAQYTRINEAIRIAQFVRNKCLRRWMVTPSATANDLQVQCSQLAKDFPFAAQLNSQARQAAADRAWQAISRFYATVARRCQARKATRASNTTIARSSTKSPAGSSIPTDDI